MTSRSDEGRARAEAIFKKQEHQTKHSEKIWAEHSAADANRARLKSLRLAKEATDQAQDRTKPSKVRG